MDNIVIDNDYFKIVDETLNEATGQQDEETIQQETTDELDVIVESLYRNSIEIKQKAFSSIEFEPPIASFSYGEPGDPFHKSYPLLYLNAITVVQGGKGSLKSRFVEMLLSAMMSETEFNGIEVNRLNRYRYLYIDTERNQRNQFPRAIQNILKANGLLDFNNGDELLKSLDLEAISLIDVKRNLRQRVLEKILATEQTKNILGKKLIIVLDVAQDLLGDFNNVEQSLSFTEYLNSLINSYDVSFILIIHENPGTTISKTVGHLGSEATRKASVVIKTTNDRAKGISFFEFLHNRDKKESNNKFAMQYDGEAGYLKLLQPEDRASHEQIVEQQNLDRIHTTLKFMAGENSLPFTAHRQDFINLFKSSYGLGDKTIIKILNENDGKDYNGFSYNNEIARGRGGNKLVFSISKQSADQKQETIYIGGANEPF